MIRLVLLAWPAHLRMRHGRALTQTLAAAWDADAGRRVPARWIRRTALLVDAIRAGLSERRAVAGPTARHAAVVSDGRAAWRAVCRRPLFSAAVVVTLGLGLGSTTAIFAVVEAVLLRPLPYPQDDQLARLGQYDASRNLSGSSFPEIAAWRALPEVASLAAFEVSALVFAGGDTPERVVGAAVTPEFFDVMGVPAELGHTMVPGDPLFDADPAIVLGHALWRRRFGGDADIIGRTLTLEARSFTVIGIMPRGFGFPAATEFWRTLPVDMRQIAEAPDLRFMEVVARLQPGVGAATLAERLDSWAGVQPPDAGGQAWRPFARSLREESVGAVRGPLLLVAGGVVLLLLIACANVTALVLANGRSRLRELATRAALGATRGRIVRQLLLEGVWLSVGGAAVAVVATSVTRGALISLSADQIPRIEQFGLNTPVLAFAAGLSLLVAIGIGLMPAWSLSRTSTLSDATRTARAVVGSRTGRRWFGTLVALEFGFAVILVAAAGLLFGSYRQLQAVDTGIVAERVGVARIVLPLTPEWRSNAARRRLHEELLDRLRTQPVFESVGLVARLPLDTSAGGTDLWQPGSPDATVRALSQMASPGYLETVGAHLVAGRAFDARDADDREPVVILNDVAAGRLFGPVDPIGQPLAFRYFTGQHSATVIGVVKAVRYGALTQDASPVMYLPVGQGTVVPLALVYRSTLDPVAVVATIRSTLAAVDPTGSVVLDEVSTLDRRLAEVVARPRFFLVLTTVFGALALLLATCGIYGTTVFWIGERWREFGLRLALGASPGGVTRLVLGRGLWLASIGIVGGLTVVAIGSRLVGHLLFGVAPTDPLTMGGAAAALWLAAGVASLVPARRAASIDPAMTLRLE